MVLPITVLAGTRPTAGLLRHLQDRGTVLVAARSAALLMDAGALILGGRLTVSEPDIHELTPGLASSSLREDLVDSVVRATRRASRPERIVVFVDLAADDLLAVISTVVSSGEISRRCSLDAVVVEVDAVEMATRLTTMGKLADDGLARALAVADRIVVDAQGQVTDAARLAIHRSLATSAGFARLVDGDTAVIGPGERLGAWHGVPDARPVEPARNDQPATIVLRLDDLLDPEAVDDWLDVLVARHAARLLRIQGALSVQGDAERTCCFGVRWFVTSHSERDHPGRRSTESVLAICGVGLDAEELAESFRATMAP